MAVARWLLGARLMYSEFMAGNITPNPVPRSSGTVKNIVVAAAGLTDTATAKAEQQECGDDRIVAEADALGDVAAVDFLAGHES